MLLCEIHERKFTNFIRSKHARTRKEEILKVVQEADSTTQRTFDLREQIR